LKDELAKLARAASPKDWLKDAHTALEAWIPDMPGARDKQLTSALTTAPDYRLNLASNNGRGRIESFAMFVVQHDNTIRFYSGTVGRVVKDVVLSNEQTFISTLLRALRTELGVAEQKIAA